MSQRLKKTIILSDENYYSQEADLAYMSVSQYKKFLECETALAKLKVNGHQRVIQKPC